MKIYTRSQWNSYSDLKRAWLKFWYKEIQIIADPPKPLPPPVVDPVNPVSPVDNNAPINFAKRQVFAGQTYFWSKRSLDEIEAFCSQMKAAGATGIGPLELMELRTTGSIGQVQSEQIAALTKWKLACARHNLILAISALNSNDVLGPTLTNDLVRARFDSLKAAVGTDGVFVQACSEDDNATNSGVRAFARSYMASIWPASQRADYAPANNGSVFREYHSDAAAQGDWRTIFVTDNNSQKYGQISDTDYIAMCKRHANQSIGIYCALRDVTIDFATVRAIAGGGAVVTPVDPVTTGDNCPPEYLAAPCWYEGARMASPKDLTVAASISSARIDANNVTFSDGSLWPLAHLCMIFRSDKGEIVCARVEGMSAGQRSQNWADNLQDNSHGHGICKDSQGRFHHLPSGVPVYAFIWEDDRKDHAGPRRTNIVPAGSI